MKYTPIEAAMDNVGISPDNNTSVANFDGDGFAYSANALAAAGVNPGSTLNANGVSLTFPNSAVGDPDNVTAQGQTIDMPNASSTATKLELLGSATNGNTQGALTITYTDGTNQTANIGFSDWTLGGGGGTLMFGNTMAVSTPYRNMTSGGSQTVGTDLFYTAPISLAAGKTVASVTLPSDSSNGQIHIFAIQLK